MIEYILIGVGVVIIGLALFFLGGGKKTTATKPKEEAKPAE